MAQGKKGTTVIKRLNWNSEQIKIYDALLKSGGKLSTREIAEFIGVSPSAARRVATALGRSDKPTIWDRQKAEDTTQNPTDIDPIVVEQEPEVDPETPEDEESDTAPLNDDPIDSLVDTENLGGNGHKEEVPAKDEIQKAKETKTTVLTTDVSNTTLIKMVPQTQVLSMTPDIFIGYMCAVKQGFKGTLGKWLSICSVQFWKDRGVNPYLEVSQIGDIGG